MLAADHEWTPPPGAQRATLKSKESPAYSTELLRVLTSRRLELVQVSAMVMQWSCNGHAMAMQWSCNAMHMCTC